MTIYLFTAVREDQIQITILNERIGFPELNAKDIPYQFERSTKYCTEKTFIGEANETPPILALSSK